VSSLTAFIFTLNANACTCTVHCFTFVFEELHLVGHGIPLSQQRLNSLLLQVLTAGFQTGVTVFVYKETDASQVDHMPMP
jgi:fatty acid desaturase